MKKLFATILVSTFALTPGASFAAESTLEVSGWVPYWRTAQGTKNASEHISKFTELNPFGYSVKSDGSLNDLSKLDSQNWKDLIDKAQDENVRVVPTIMWSDTNAIHATLSDAAKRKDHVEQIVREIDRRSLDGIDIDYEGKKAETRVFYSAFLKELSTELKKGNSPKWLQCTIEARMPLSARYSGTPPANIEYANDLPSINRYCDRVRIMTYDQQTADIELNRAHQKELYAPIADAAWVRKVVNYMAQDISKDKIMIGIATYGYIWQAMPKADGSGYTYIKTESFNPQYGVDTAKEHGITPTRGKSGEIGFTYVPKETTSLLPSQSQLSKYAPRGTASALLAALGSLAYAKEEHRQAPITYLTWSDGEAIQQKIDLAQKLKIKGVSIFKIDGGMDPNLWDVLPKEAPKLTKAPAVASDTPTTAAPANTSYAFNTNLVYGTTNTDVKRLQTILVTQGHLKLTEPTLFFGPMTLAAVRSWQAANSIQTTGNFGPLSRAKMATFR